VTQSIITQDEVDFGYLFPYRDKIPKVESHIFSDLQSINTPLNEYIIETMMSPEYIGWAAKELLGVELAPMQMAVIHTLWTKPFPMLIGCRGASKTFMLAVFSTLKAILDQGSRVVLVGGGLRQAKLVFEYIDTLWRTAPVFRNVVGGGLKAGPKTSVDLCYFNIGRSKIMALPMGDGSKIRGFRANVIIADEFASIDPTIFDIVIRGFGIVSQSPIEEAKKLDLIRRMKAAGVEKDEIEDIMEGEVSVKGNQIVRAGTAYYAFNHFYRAFERQKAIIRSGGDRTKLGEIFNGAHNIPENFDYRDYALIRIPFTHLPPGLLEPKMLADAKASVPRNIFLMEYGAVFVKDSDGFFPRSLIEASTCKLSKPVVNPDGQIVFTALGHGEQGRRYVMGIDPAAERDNFAVIICEVWPNHSRVVYCWTINKPEFKKRKKRGLTTEDDYYGYCCCKIRDLVRAFEPFRIEMDSQGGGYAFSELLRNEKLLDKKKGDFPIYEIIEQGEPKDTDGKIGRHILHLVQQSSDFNQVSNMAMHKGFETKRLVFPAYDSVQIEAALIAEREAGVEFDTYEDVANEIEELKSEICTIHKTETPSGKERFDTPSVVTGASVEGRQTKGRLRKDRYTALLLCYRHIHDTEVSFVPGIDYNDVAGNFEMVNKKEKEPMYKGRGVGHMKNAQGYIQGKVPYGGVQRNERI